MRDTITCPSCGTDIEVTEVLSAQLREQLRQEFATEQRKREQEFAAKEAVLVKMREQLAASQASLDEEVQKRVSHEKQKLAQDCLAKAKEQVAVDIADMQAQLTEAKGKLQESQKTELVLRKERRELEEQKAALDLEVERKLDEERGKIRDSAKKEAEQERQLRDADKDKLISDLRTQIEELRRKSEQGSQQLQGEVLELTLEEYLRREFPTDSINPVPKGVHGGDVVQIVRDKSGAECGSILWESKRTKAWSDTWLPKLRDDQRAAKAQVAILVSIELPRQVSAFTNIDGVWVASWSCCMGVAAALRVGLVEVAHVRRSADGKQGKMELLYSYLSSQEFRHRVEGIVEAFETLRLELDREKRAMTGVWARREKQLERALINTAGLYGDLSGITGGHLAAIEKLELPALPHESDESGHVHDPAE